MPRKNKLSATSGPLFPCVSPPEAWYAVEWQPKPCGPWNTMQYIPRLTDQTEGIQRARALAARDHPHAVRVINLTTGKQIWSSADDQGFEGGDGI